MDDSQKYLVSTGVFDGFDLPSDDDPKLDDLDIGCGQGFSFNEIPHAHLRGDRRHFVRTEPNAQRHSRQPGGNLLDINLSVLHAETHTERKCEHGQPPTITVVASIQQKALCDRVGRRLFDYRAIYRWTGGA